jgi:hypothetical protein
VRATVTVANGKHVNQGVRIDLISQDIAAVVPREEVPDEDDALFWSLNDNLESPQPIIGRDTFREMVTSMSAPDAERVLVVTGPPESGLQFSIKLLRRTLGTGVPMAIFSPKQLQDLTPKGFLRTLVEHLGVSGLTTTQIPELLSTESVPRWLRTDLPRWLSDSLSKDRELNPTKYPVWVIINTVVPTDESFLWAENLRDLLAALVGGRDFDNRGTDLPQLRWLFLQKDLGAATNKVPLPTVGVRQFVDDLNLEASAVEGFVDCMQRAYRSIDKNVSLAEDLLRRWALYELRGNDILSPDQKVPPRKVLANLVRGIYVNDPELGSGGW